MKNSYFPIKLLVLFTFLCTFCQPCFAVQPSAQIVPVKQKIKTTKNINNLADALKAGVPVIVKLGSDRCIPCRAMNPIIKELAAEQDGKAVFLALDVYQNRELAGQYGVRVIPTVIFFDKHGKFKAKAEGFMDKDQLLNKVNKLELNK
ncbi:MAG: thioredoxin family protein [Candidatus Margulisiibacteriota bacterium]